jgi:small subunit ribosomal protein S6
MPKYELMYILSSAVSDNDVPTVSNEVDKFITDNGGKILTTEMLGKKKLAYPIKKTRNGFYVLETFNLEGKALQALDNKLRSMEPIIRYLVVALDEQEKRAAKDLKVQQTMNANRKPVAVKAEASVAEVKLSDSELDQKIEKALDSKI